jgi:hypothetical protein
MSQGHPRGKEKRAELARLVDGGMSLRQATRAVGLSYARGSSICKELGVMVQMPRDAQAREEIVDALRRRWSDEDVAGEFSVTLNTARRWRAQFGRMRLALYPLDASKAAQLVASGVSKAEVARQMQCAVSTVFRACQRAA